jgi:hypothetical protein
MPRFSKKNFWAIITFGVAQSWLVRILVEASYKPDQTGAILARFPSLLFAPGHNLFLLGLINAIPFIVFAFLTRWRYRMSAAEGAKTFRPHKWGIVGAGLVVFGMTVFIQWVVWADVFNPAGGSSTAVIAFIFLPFYALALMPVGYLVGYLLGRVAVRKSV